MIAYDLEEVRAISRMVSPPESHMRFQIHAAVAAALMALPAAGAAQGVIVQSTTDVRFHGPLGVVAGVASRLGGGTRDIRSTTSIVGHKMRTESSDAAAILDADAGRVTHIDHKQKTYTSVTFAEMAAAMERAAHSAKQSAAKAEAAPPRDPNAPKGDVKVKYRVSLERPGDRAKVAGYDAERVFLTITIDAEATPEGEKTEQAGSLVFLLDQWMSKDAPQIAALEDFQRAYAQKVGEAFRPQVAGLQAAFAADPRMKGGFEAAAKELQKVPGIPLRSVTYVSAVPAGMTFDRQLALNAGGAAAPADNAKKDEKPKTGGFRGLMGAIKSAAEEANKQPSGDKSAKQEVKQVTLVTVIDEVTSIARGAVPPGTFAAPAGYREVKPNVP